LQAAVLSVGTGFMLSLWLLLFHVPFVFTYLFPGVLGQVALEDLAQDIRRDERLLSTAPDPVLAGQLEQDLHAEARLRSDLKAVRDRRDAILASSSWFVHSAVYGIEAKLLEGMRFQVHAIKGPQKMDATLPEIGPDARRNAATVHQVLNEQRRASAENTLHDAVQGAALMLVWPVLWVFWAALTRGGLALALSGVAVVQRDGRRAARWRCVVRALLIWVPFGGLLLVSLLLDSWRVAAAGPEAESRAAAWLAWLLWWLAVAWLPLHLLLVLRWPDRSWHDRLAGTFLVPR
jgi:hypothetical protein